MDSLLQLLEGFHVALTWQNVAFMMIGVLLGIIVGYVVSLFIPGMVDLAPVAAAPEAGPRSPRAGSHPPPAGAP